MKTKHIQYQTQGTCSQLIDVTADENDVIQQVFFLGGCNGNLAGLRTEDRRCHLACQRNPLRFQAHLMP